MDTPYSGLMNEAPDFSSGYPSKGERIGPWWQDAWALLADGKPRTRFEIAQAVRTSNLSDLTVRNLLQGARRAGYLDAVIGTVHRATVYRRLRP